MDPDATWKLVTDESLPLPERAEAALNLLVWLAKGGALPHYTTAVSISTMHAYIVEQCEGVIVKVFDHMAGEEDRLDEAAHAATASALFL